SITEQHACFDKNWILQLNKQGSIRDFICLICKQVADSPMEINCIQHKNMDELLIQQISTQQRHEEGEIPGIVSCDFKGKLKQMNDHLEHSCGLQMVKCWFESFGYNHKYLKSAICLLYDCGIKKKLCFVIVMFSNFSCLQFC
ncbi:hypothetical protein RFI_00893, partial [Reticulomyxa filosa]